jgi:signal transduction histidine kinase
MQMHGHYIAVLSIPAFFLLLAGGLCAQPLLTLSEAEGKYDLIPYLWVFEDKDEKFSLEDLLNSESESHFRPLLPPEPNFGYTNSTVWMRFRVFNTDDYDRNYYLNFHYAFIHDLTIYIIDSNNRVTEKKAGIELTPREREIRHRKNIILIPVEERSEVTVYIRAKSNVALSLGMTLWSAEAHAEQDRDSYLLFGLFYGMLVIMAIYNLFLFFSIRDKSYLYYFLYCSSFVFYQMTIDGLLLLYILNDFFTTPEYMPAFPLGAMLFFRANFSRHFLLTFRHSQNLDTLLKVYMGIAAIYALMSVTIETRLLSTLSAPIACLFLFIVYPAAITVLRRGYTPAIYYIIAINGFALGLLIRVLKLYAIIPEGMVPLYSMQVGILFEMIVLSFALGYRINKIRAEQEQEKAAIRNQIARDLHDEVGSNLGSIVLASQLLIRNNNLSAPEKQQMREIGETATSTADTLRDIVWFINPVHDRFDDLILKMKDISNSMLRGFSVDFKISMETETVDFDPDIRKNVFMIYREALHNIMKHSNATQVRIEVIGKRKLFELIISDNGSGFETKGLNRGEGLTNMRKRAEKIGARLFINSSNGTGTTVSLVTRTTRLRDVFSGASSV